MKTKCILVGNVFIFALWKYIYLQMPLFLSNLFPDLRDLYSAQVTQDGGSKLLLKIFYFNFVLFVCRLGRAPWQIRMVTCWSQQKVALFRDSAHRGLQFSSATYNCSLLFLLPIKQYLVLKVCFIMMVHWKHSELFACTHCFMYPFTQFLVLLHKAQQQLTLLHVDST
jgi:hypothetical protein